MDLLGGKGQLDSLAKLAFTVEEMNFYCFSFLSFFLLVLFEKKTRRRMRRRRWLELSKKTPHVFLSGSSGWAEDVLRWRHAWLKTKECCRKGRVLQCETANEQKSRTESSENSNRMKPFISLTTRICKGCLNHEFLVI